MKRLNELKKDKVTEHKEAKRVRFKKDSPPSGKPVLSNIAFLTAIHVQPRIHEEIIPDVPYDAEKPHTWCGC